MMINPSPIAVPGVVVLGPLATVDIGLRYEIGARGRFLVRNNLGWSNMTARINMLNGSDSFIGQWVPTPAKPLLSLELVGKFILDPYILAGFKFGVDFLTGTLELTAGLEFKGSLPVTVETTLSYESSNNDTPKSTVAVGCQGFNVSLAAKIEA
jgi:hypothetical protein